MSEPPVREKEKETIWTFACEHRLRTCPIPNGGFKKAAPPPASSSSEHCPMCKEKDRGRRDAAIEAARIEAEASRTAAEAAAHQLEKDKQALAIWKKQRTELEAHIIKAKANDDAESVKALETMLGMCNRMWGKKIVKIEERRAGESYLKELHGARGIDTAIKDLTERLGAIIDADKALKGVAQERIDDSESSIGKLMSLKNNLDEIAYTYYEKLHKPLGRIEAGLRNVETEMPQSMKEKTQAMQAQGSEPQALEPARVLNQVRPP